MSRVIIRAALGISLVLHGLANAVLPLRGVDVVAPGTWAPPFVVAYVLAIVGFTAAGLGVLGVRPLRSSVTWAPLLAGVSSLGAQIWMTSADLWAGVALSVLLPILAVLWGATTPRAPAVAPRRGWRLAGDAVGVALLLWVSASAVLWPWHRAWGSHAHEWAMTLPGDRLPRTPHLELLHGVTIDVPPSAVWPWLAQLGQDRAGFYSYDWLERLLGVDVRNVTELRPEWQRRQTGDYVPAVQEHYLGDMLGERPGWTVDLAAPNQALVLRNWGAFVLVPDLHGRTRLLIRSTVSHDRIPAWAAAVNFTAFELPHFIMQRRMLLTIKALAEESAQQQAGLR